jgi:hypothetical protein
MQHNYEGENKVVLIDHYKTGDLQLQEQQQQQGTPNNISQINRAFLQSVQAPK